MVRAPANEMELEALLSRPATGVVEMMRRLKGDLIVLGVGGKMGPSIARMARRASEAAGVRRRIIGVARFSSRSVAGELEAAGIEPVRCDLLDEEDLERLPEVENVLYLAGMKFGATAQTALTWAMNALLPAMVCRKYQRSRIVAFSTGNVYGLGSVASGGSVETDEPAPAGEYAMSCLGRERMFEHFSRRNGTSIALLRLNYACDLRYGVLVDLAQKVLAGTPIDLGMSWFNTIWQGDANAMSLLCFEHTDSPPFVCNVTGPEILDVRQAALRLGELLGKEPLFSGQEQPTALLSNAARAFQLFGKPKIDAETLLHWVADWLRRGGSTLKKPTHYESREGRF